MSANTASKNYGPLPKVLRTDELEQQSIDALKLALPKDRFLLREEDRDKGVDVTIELLIDSQAMNWRSQVQLKSTDSAKANQDGSVSYQIETSNLNYLSLGNNTAIYVLYIAPRNELRFAWATDERKRLNQENPDWIQQQTVTIRFRNVLTLAATEQIHARILREGRLHKEINDRLSYASFAEQVTVNINAETLETIDPDETKEMLLSSGITMVSSGYGSLVLGAIQVLRYRDTQLPRVLTVQAYAHYTLGGYQDALACIAKALLRQEELSQTDRQLLANLRNSCRYQTGQLDYSEYHQLLENEECHEGEISFHQRLNQLRYALREGGKQPNRPEILLEFRSLVNEMLEASDITDASKLDAKLALLEAEGSQLVYGAIEGFSQIHMRCSLGTLSFHQMQAILQEQSASMSHWFSEMRAAIEEANRLKNPLLIGNSLTIMALINIGSLSIRRNYALMIGEEMSWPQNMLQAMMDEVERARKIYKLAGQLEGELRAQLLLADLFLLANQPEAAQRLASSVLPKAQAMDYIALQTKASEHLSGQTPMQNMEMVIIAAATEDQDWKIATNTDEEMLDFARDCLKAFDLPRERLSVVEREVFSERAIARERLNWCRHIEIIQDLKHMNQPATRYRFDPQRFCACKKHNFKSAIGHTDSDTVISTFKQAYCGGCLDRSPKQK